MQTGGSSLPARLGKRTGLCLAWVLAAAGAQAQTQAEQACAQAVQGRVAWNQQGNKAWSPGNVQNLCRGTVDPATTIACFEAGIRQHGAWARAIAECQAQPEAEPAFTAPAAPPQPAANGRNVVAVTAGQGGQRVAEFRRSGGPGQWVELAATGGIKFRFQETQRDDWSVYLVDASRGVNLQLDLHTRKVMYSDARTPPTALYDILAASAPALVAPPPLAQAPLPPVAEMVPAAPMAAPEPPPPPALPAVNGRTVTQVVISQQGRRVGDYRISGQGRWVEVDANGRAAFAFDETGRDDWSVYLTDRSRGVNVQLDLHTRKVMYSDARSPRRALYDIADASGGSVTAALPMAAPAPAPAPAPAAAPPPPPPPPPVVVNGRNVRKVLAGQGGAVKSVFVQSAPGRWSETDAAGRARFGFEESGRDEWSVYLLDRSRGVSIQLDLHTRKVMYRDGNKPMQPLYDVLGATHSP